MIIIEAVLCILIICIVVIVSLIAISPILYYITVFATMNCYDTKKEFFKDMIIYRMWIREVSEVFKELK